MPKRILVTGGAGFVGSHTVDALLAQGHQVRVLDSLSPQVHAVAPPAYLSADVEFIEADMRDMQAVRRAVAGVEVVYHLAAAVGVGQSMYEIAHYMGANTQGTANLLQALLDSRSRVEKLIVASSMSIYGEGEYQCSNCGVVAPPPRQGTQLAA
jgi:dTDP-L-rhamnose 4-epimerase